MVFMVHSVLMSLSTIVILWQSVLLVDTEMKRMKMMKNKVMVWDRLKNVVELNWLSISQLSHVHFQQLYPSHLSSNYFMHIT
jgi:hypothetical protein